MTSVQDRLSAEVISDESIEKDAFARRDIMLHAVRSVIDHMLAYK